MSLGTVLVLAAFVGFVMLLAGLEVEYSRESETVYEVDAAAPRQFVDVPRLQPGMIMRASEADAAAALQHGHNLLLAQLAGTYPLARGIPAAATTRRCAYCGGFPTPDSGGRCGNCGAPQ